MKHRRSTKRATKSYKRRSSSRRTKSKTIRRHRNSSSRHGGSLGSIPRSAIVSIQQDPYSARILVDADTAEEIFEARGPTQL